MALISSFFRSLKDLGQKSILGFAVLVPFLAGLCWLVLALLILSFFGAQLETWLAGVEWLSGFRSSLEGIGITLGGTLTALILIILFAPLVYWTSLILLAVLALPWIMRFLRPRYPQAFAKAQSLSLISTWRLSAKVFLKATPLYAVLIATAWVPGLFVIGNFILSAWVNAHFLAIEVLGEVTDEREMLEIMNEKRTTLFVMGCGLMALLLVPIVQLFTPVLGGLWFAHYLLGELQRRRS